MNEHYDFLDERVRDDNCKTCGKWATVHNDTDKCYECDEKNLTSAAAEIK